MGKEFDSKKVEVYHMGMNLSMHQTLHTDCVYCDGGANKDKNTLVITKTKSSAEGMSADIILYVCHRASCGVRGVINIWNENDDISFPKPHMEEAESKPFPRYKYPTHAISGQDIELYQGLYPALTEQAVKYFKVTETDGDECGNNTLHVPLSAYKRNYSDQGYHLRSVWPGVPDKFTYWYSSALVKDHKGAWFSTPQISAPYLNRSAFLDKLNSNFLKEVHKRTVVVTEDVLSALCVSNFMDSYALLGSGISKHKATTTFRDVDNVILWLDPDMWEIRPGGKTAPIIEQIITLSQTLNVIPRKLEEDPKYLEVDTLCEFLLEDLDACAYESTENWYDIAE